MLEKLVNNLEKWGRTVDPEYFIWSVGIGTFVLILAHLWMKGF